MRAVLSLFLGTFLATSLLAVEPTHHEVLVIIGAPGEEAYAARFLAAAERVKTACEEADIPVTVVGSEAQESRRENRELVREWLEYVASTDARALWIVYLGHGSWDGRDARLNLRGTDLTATELAEWLEGTRTTLVFVHGGAASAPFIPALSGENRVIITATESGDEINYARFGEAFATAIAGDAADFDEDGQVSALEAFIAANHETETFYREEGRMQTEHALLDDNGDGHGTPAAWFRGNKADRDAAGGRNVDGKLAAHLALIETEFERSLTAEQRQLRDQVEREIETLKGRKSTLPEDEYFEKLEELLRRLAPIYVPSRDT